VTYIDRMIEDRVMDTPPGIQDMVKGYPATQRYLKVAAVAIVFAQFLR